MENLHEDIVIDLLEHFHPEAMNNGGWPIVVKDEEVFIIESEFPNLELYEDGSQLMVRKLNDNFTPKQEVTLFRYERDVYKEEADRFWNGIYDFAKDMGM